MKKFEVVTFMVAVIGLIGGIIMAIGNIIQFCSDGGSNFIVIMTNIGSWITFFSIVISYVVLPVIVGVKKYIEAKRNNEII